VKATKTSGGSETLVRHTIPLGIVLFLVLAGSLYGSTVGGLLKCGFIFFNGGGGQKTKKTEMTSMDAFRRI